MLKEMNNRPTNLQKLTQLYKDEEKAILDKINNERRGAMKGLSLHSVIAKRMEKIITPQNDEEKEIFDASIRF